MALAKRQCTQVNRSSFRLTRASLTEAGCQSEGENIVAASSDSEDNGELLVNGDDRLGIQLGPSSVVPAILPLSERSALGQPAASPRHDGGHPPVMASSDSEDMEQIEVESD